jgi:hypothetical protein
MNATRSNAPGRARQPLFRLHPPRSLRLGIGPGWALLGALWLGNILDASAVTRSQTYDVQHNFRLTPGGNVVPQVTAFYYAHAWASHDRPYCRKHSVQPPASTQPRGWSAFGRDRATRSGRVSNSGHTANLGQINVGAGGLPAQTISADAPCPSAHGQGNSTIAVNALAAGGAVSGSIRAHGFATATAPPPRGASAYAFSMSKVEARGGRQMRNGRINWGPVVRDVVSGSASASARTQSDPITYRVEDLVTGEVFEGILFAVEADLMRDRGVGGFIWETNLVQITAGNARFEVVFPSPLTSLQGQLLLVVSNGMVTTSSGTGHFAGALPPVGTPVPLSFPLSTAVEFDYDLGDFQGHQVDVSLDFGGGGEALAAVSSEEVTLLSVDSVTPPSGTPTVIISWPDSSSNLVLLTTSTLGGTELWRPAPGTPEHVGDRFVQELPALEPAAYFRGIVPDTTPPGFIGWAKCGLNSVWVEFDEHVLPHTAMMPGNYSVMAPAGPLILVTAVEPWAEDSYQLFLSEPLLPGTTYVLEVRGVSDLAGNLIPPGTLAEIRCDLAGDITPPGFTAGAICGQNAVTVTFDEPVLPETATLPGNYSIMGPGGLVMAPLMVEQLAPTSVRLQLPELILPGQPYGLEVRNVSDLQGNVIPPGSLTEFQCQNP